MSFKTSAALVFLTYFCIKLGYVSAYITAVQYRGTPFFDQFGLSWSDGQFGSCNIVEIPQDFLKGYEQYASRLAIQIRVYKRGTAKIGVPPAGCNTPPDCTELNNDQHITNAPAQGEPRIFVGVNSLTKLCWLLPPGQKTSKGDPFEWSIHVLLHPKPREIP